jgi:hypothetical protein
VVFAEWFNHLYPNKASHQAGHIIVIAFSFDLRAVKDLAGVLNCGGYWQFLIYVWQLIKTTMK